MPEEEIDQWRKSSMGWLIAVLGNEMAAALDARLKELGLKISMWPTLLMLWQEDGLTQTELSTRCRTAHYATTRTLDALEKKGLIERKQHPSSRRAHQVFLTEAGKALRHEGLKSAIETNEEFLSPLSENETQTLLKLLLKLVESRTEN